jgi:3-oxoacyl-[acyl-carrier protein] reductase
MENSKKTALVTGASRGIGKAIATTLAQCGYKVIGSATTDDGAAAISEYLREFSGVGVKLNVNDFANIETNFNELANKYGDISILVNNAGITRDGLFLRMKVEDWDQIMDTNLKSIFVMCKVAVRSMMKIRFGRIVNITSLVGFTGNVGQCNYAAAKAGVVSFSKSLAKEIGSRNITVNCVAPGFIQTDMTDKLSEEVKQQYIKNIPLNRFGSVDDIAAGVKFLVSDDANYITGTTLHINGGMYM